MIPVGKLVSSTNSLFSSGNSARTFHQKTRILKGEFDFPGELSIREMVLLSYKAIYTQKSPEEWFTFSGGEK